MANHNLLAAFLGRLTWKSSHRLEVDDITNKIDNISLEHAICHVCKHCLCMHKIYQEFIDLLLESSALRPN